MRTTFYNAKSNTVYINSDLILPNTDGLSFKEHCKRYGEAFKLSYQERVKKFTPQQYKQEILDILAAHEGCNITEFTDI